MTSTQGTTGWSSLSQLGKASVIGGLGSTLTGVIGAYYASESEKYKTKSQALSLEHKKDMALFNMRMKESQAQHLNRVFNSQYQIATLKAGAAKSKARTSFAARGIQMGVGSTKDAFVSDEIMKEIDKITMNSNKVRAISNKRLEAVGLGIQADSYGLSASNLFATASQISPWMNMSSSLLTGAAGVLGNLPTNLLTKSTSSSNQKPD